MENIEKSNIASYEEKSGAKIPKTVDYICPHCKRQLTFVLNLPSIPNVNLNYCQSRCPACGKKPLFILVNLKSKDKKDLKEGELYIYPQVGFRKQIDGIDEIDELPDTLKRAYASAIKIYNTREWNGTSVLSRRVLEGIVKTILKDSDRKRNLAEQIEILPDNIDLDKPILNLAQVLRKGGNLGAHFDLEKETNEVSAKLMIDLLDNLLEYLFILPKRVEQLEKEIDQYKKQ